MKHTPNIRFNGFSDEWEKKRLGDCGKFNSNGVDKKSLPNENPVNLLNYMDVFTKKYITAKNCKNLMQVTAKNEQLTKNNVLANDIFFTPSSETAEDIGHVLVIEEDLPNTVYSYHLMRFRPDQTLIYKTFPNYGFESSFVRKQLVREAKGVQRFVLSKPSFENIEVLLPSTLAEQEQIAALFSGVDSLIAEQQAKLQHLQHTKATLLTKLFPQNGKNTPEIRFKGFSGEWEKKQLGDCGDFYTGLSGKSKGDFGHGNGKYITYMNVFTNTITSQQMTEAIEIDNKQNAVKKGDIFFTTSSETPEEVGMTSVLTEEMPNTYLNSFCFGFRPKTDANSYYLAYFLRSNSFRKEICLLAQGISRFNISKSKVKNLTLLLPPTLAEQEQIAALFSEMDVLITEQERMVTQLEHIKESLLAECFC